MFSSARLLVPCALLAACSAAGDEPAAAQASAAPESAAPTLYRFEARTLEGAAAPLRQYEGRPVLVVNVASKCGLTPQYAGLQALQDRYADRGLVILGFPCNQFNGQEPGSPAEIAQFCSEKFAVTFPLMEKVEVQPGPGQSPVYAWLQQRTGEVPTWNFSKYLVARDGVTVRYFGPRTSPDDAELVAAIEAALGG